ncbi:hypothetical protein Clacol_001000 [Clathrus columnatus]|uniref:Uncharacterized protein n=1 Tax=Clathrus columnatus TaxID=1419009 RepID=A0AAV5A238_9AGAM|nr:hypothetical protein Clacol_001000 [Clathrus columnatus]
MHTMLRLLPMSITGFVLNVIVGFVVRRVDVLWLLVTGTLATGCGCLLFAVIDPSAPYWAFGFPASILSVWGADFIFACGTLFVARVAHADEQSLAGGVFQTVAQLGKAFGLAITTNVYNSVAMSHHHPLEEPHMANTPPLEAFKAAQWTGFGFAILGSYKTIKQIFSGYRNNIYVFPALILALIFLRGVGIVGHRDTTNLSKSTQSESEIEAQSQTGTQTELPMQMEMKSQNQLLQLPTLAASQEDLKDPFRRHTTNLTRCISSDSLIDAKSG